MTVQFKGISEYKKKYKIRRARPASESSHRKMRLAGLRSDQLGISREPQFLSRRKVPFYKPQTSSSFQWAVSDELLQGQGTVRPGSPLAVTPVAVTNSPEEAEVPLAPRNPKPIGTSSASPQSREEVPATQPSSGDTQRQDPRLTGVDHALRRKAGLRSNRQKNGYESSEYQRQFKWKSPVAASPLLAAHQMLNTSSRSIPPFKSNPVVAESEYTRNFKGSPPPRPPRLRRDVEQMEVPLFHKENVSPLSNKRKKRKEQHLSRKSGSKEELPGFQQEKLQTEVRSQSAQRNSAPTVGHRGAKTEYNSNFQSPLTYHYRDGVWVKTRTVGEEACDSDHGHEWYYEVKELREKAEAYKKRAWGTHFSRLHLNQILSEQNCLWEPSSASSTSTLTEGNRSSASSPVIEALDLARVESVRGSSSPGAFASQGTSRRSSIEEASLPEGPTIPVQRKLAWGEEVGPREASETEAEQPLEEPQVEERKETTEKRVKEEEEHGGKKGNFRHKREEVRVTVGQPMSPVMRLESYKEGGRLPTPELKTLAAMQRTHHDRTTPATGGALLVSPPRPKNSNKVVRRSEPPLGKPHSPYKHLHSSSVLAASKTDTGSLPSSSPAAGVATVDPLPLREDSWHGEHINCSTGEQPVKLSNKRNTGVQSLTTILPPANRIQGTMRNPEFQHNGNLGHHRPELFLFPSSDSAVSDDDDRMSQISSRSAASCSLASEVLNRAQRRKEDFWGKS
ncbi:nuclear protein MDM1 [Chanos chanos]|uniref:Nuclear protein MDM1 n=1 Tax=Chanos chanos TaxID=29144 RepID=A0A6J2VTD4_CHACN|nr:nuclear protein MDM1 [Chanos chanos]